VSDQFPEHRERAIGLFTSIFPIGGIVGPNLGGWIVSQYSWRYIFYINLPIGIELMPEKVATFTGLRGIFRGGGGAFGISLITVILHLSSTPGNGFSITFISFGLGLLFTIPLVFLMPTGKKIGGPKTKKQSHF
jgi:Major Facilitator Superfamily